MNDEELYRQNILDHYKNPRNKREMPDATLHGKEVNASCGDKVDFYVKIDGGRVTDSSFSGDGCAVSQAAASMLTEKLKGMAENDLRAIAPGDIYNMLGVKISPGRVNCALLAYEGLNQSILGGSTSK